MARRDTPDAVRQTEALTGASRSPRREIAAAAASGAACAVLFVAGLVFADFVASSVFPPSGSWPRAHAHRAAGGRVGRMLLPLLAGAAVAFLWIFVTSALLARQAGQSGAIPR